MTNHRRPRKQAQASFEEHLVMDSDLERLLEDREEAREELQPYRLNYKGLNDQVKAKLEQKELELGTHRIGGFVVKITESAEREVSFERQSSRRYSIKPAKT